MRLPSSGPSQEKENPDRVTHEQRGLTQRSGNRVDDSGVVMDSSDQLGSMSIIIFLLYIAAIIWVAIDAVRRGHRAGLWAGIVLVFNFMGFAIYLVYRRRSGGVNVYVGGRQNVTPGSPNRPPPPAARDAGRSEPPVSNIDNIRHARTRTNVDTQSWHQNEEPTPGFEEPTPAGPPIGDAVSSPEPSATPGNSTSGSVADGAAETAASDLPWVDKKCHFCQTVFVTGDHLEVCYKCTPQGLCFHEKCWRKLGQCTTRGCANLHGTREVCGEPSQ